ncbi:hypothetical protein [Methanocaldococcus fervens]|uniref:Uncharacterized protein n=1 Tax=Methanocaldococcus fervens (strain DSM 4213 / JCM 15782 / AG86) TaxID=573064 RepID=C7P8Z8_METFA|nr:hypothetical protein [Methanocaldococcus fervens]ACV25030.1 hypothetical protein Mefer_1221 [Methanocaldococcus fervens AG86]
MINTIDLVIGTAILLIGMAYWTVSVVEHNNNYVDAIKTDYIFDKGLATMEHLSEDGTLENTVLLYYFNRTDEAKKLLEDRIPLKHYELYIDENLLINKSGSYNNTVEVLVILTLNRKEGWYVIYGDENSIDISDKRFLDWNEAYNCQDYKQYKIHLPVYLSRNITSSKVKLRVFGN